MLDMKKEEKELDTWTNVLDKHQFNIGLNILEYGL
jgi:hypothetical protein